MLAVREPRITRVSRISRTGEKNWEYSAVGNDLVHEELSQAIIGAAMSVLNELKPGLDEKLYENALVIELRRLGHHVEQQARYSVYYRGELIGALIPDLIVDGLVIVDTKVVELFCDEPIAKMIGYRAKTNLALAILINSKHASLKWKRVVRQEGMK